MGQPFLFDFKQHRVAGRIIVLTLHRSLLSMAPLKQVKQVYWIVLVRVSQAHKEKQKTKNKPCHPSNQIKATLISSSFPILSSHHVLSASSPSVHWVCPEAGWPCPGHKRSVPAQP